MRPSVYGACLRKISGLTSDLREARMISDRWRDRAVTAELLLAEVRDELADLRRLTNWLDEGVS